MKKILIAIVCLALMCCFSMSAFAEDVEPPIAPEENLTNEVNWDEVKETFSSTVMVWIQENIEEIGVVVTLMGYGIVLIKRFKSNDKKIVTMNNNAIAIAKEATACTEKQWKALRTQRL